MPFIYPQTVMGNIIAVNTQTILRLEPGETHDKGDKGFSGVLLTVQTGQEAEELEINGTVETLGDLIEAAERRAHAPEIRPLTNREGLTVLINFGHVAAVEPIQIHAQTHSAIVFVGTSYNGNPKVLLVRETPEEICGLLRVTE